MAGVLTSLNIVQKNISQIKSTRKIYITNKLKCYSIRLIPITIFTTSKISIRSKRVTGRKRCLG